MALKSKGRDLIERAVVELRAFNSITTSACANEYVAAGRLPVEYFDQVQDRKLMVIYSYGTPIAWLDEATREWTVPNVRYSVTTTNHQNVARAAIARVSR